jgi:hypothetical protein
VYNLKIVGLTAQQDMQSLIKILLRFPGLDSEKIAKGLKIPPFTVVSVEQEAQAQQIKAALEKLGAMCVVEDTMAFKEERSLALRTAAIKRIKPKNPWGIWIGILAAVVFAGIIEVYLSSLGDKAKKDTQKSKPKTSVEQGPAQAQEQKQQQPLPQSIEAAEKAIADANAAKSKNELKSDLSKNPYNSGAWKALFDKLTYEGDVVSASKAKESYDKALKAQKVLSSLAKAFGNEIRVEIAEGAVYYRISKNLSDSDFYHEAEKLREALNSKFPDKDMVLENYGPNNKVQTIRLKGAYSTGASAG